MKFRVRNGTCALYYVPGQRKLRTIKVIIWPHFNYMVPSLETKMYFITYSNFTSSELILDKTFTPLCKGREYQLAKQSIHSALPSPQTSGSSKVGLRHSDLNPGKTKRCGGGGGGGGGGNGSSHGSSRHSTVTLPMSQGLSGLTARR